MQNRMNAEGSDCRRIRWLVGTLLWGAASLGAPCAGAAQLPANVGVPRYAAPAVDSARAFVQSLLVRSLPVRVSADRVDTLTFRTPGIAAAVAVDGAVVWSEGFGFADLEHGVPVTPQTRFRIGSVSKLITAMALMRLVDEGRIDLDAPVETYVPSFPASEPPVTSRLLAGHLGGVRHYLDDDPVGHQAYRDLTAGLSIFQDDSLRSTPGSAYLYSSYGYNLLGVAIERASQRPFLEQVQESVLTPLAMWSTVADHKDTVIANRSGFYEMRRPGLVFNAPYDDVSYKWPSGGFLSTAEDLTRLGSAILSSGFLSDGSLRTLLTSQRTDGGAETGVGIGWRIGKDEQGRTFYHHGGAATGGRGFLLVYPDERLVVALASNLQSPYDENDAMRIARWFVPGPS